MLRREEVSKFCDVYSYGVLVFEIATQEIPFPDVLPIMVPAMIVEGKVSDCTCSKEVLVNLGNATHSTLTLVLTCKVAVHNPHASKYLLYEYMNVPKQIVMQVLMYSGWQQAVDSQQNLDANQLN